MLMGRKELERFEVRQHLRTFKNTALGNLVLNSSKNGAILLQGPHQLNSS